MASEEKTVFEIDQEEYEDENNEKLNELNIIKEIKNGDFLKIDSRDQSISIKQITEINKDKQKIKSISTNLILEIDGRSTNILREIGDFNRENNITNLVNSTGIYDAPQTPKPKPKPKIGGKRRRRTNKRSKRRQRRTNKRRRRY